MASVSKISLISEEALTATKTGLKKSLEARSLDFIGYMHVSANDGATTIDAKIQQSADGVNWLDVVTFTQVVNVTSFEQKQITIALLPYVRAIATFTAGASATLKVDLYYNKYS